MSDPMVCPFCRSIRTRYQMICDVCRKPLPQPDTRPAPASATMAEIVAAAEAWVEAERDEATLSCDASEADRTAARARFLSLVAAHSAEVAKVLEPFAEAIRKIEKSQNYGYGLATLSDCVTDDDLRAAADLRRRVTAATHEKKEG